MLNYEKARVIGYIGSSNFVKGQRKDYIRLTVSPGTRTSRGETIKIWYNVMVPLEQIPDRARFEEMYLKGRRLIAEGNPYPEAFVDPSTGALRAEITIITDVLPFLLDSPSSPRR